MSDAQRSMLDKLSWSQPAPQRQVARAKVLLQAADGAANDHIAARLSDSR
jgi:hypothetical protein